MDTRLTIDCSRVDPQGEEIEGEVDCIDLAEDLVHPFGGVRYRLSLQVFGDELLVRGHLEQDFDLVCCRCGKDFDDTIKVEDFTISVPFDEKKPEVDITEDVREALILALPTYPNCGANCPGVEQKVEAEEEVDARWSALDKIAGCAAGGGGTPPLPPK